MPVSGSKACGRNARRPANSTVQDGLIQQPRHITPRPVTIRYIGALTPVSFVCQRTSIHRPHARLRKGLSVNRLRHGKHRSGPARIEIAKPLAAPHTGRNQPQPSNPVMACSIASESGLAYTSHIAPRRCAPAEKLSGTATRTAKHHLTVSHTQILAGNDEMPEPEFQPESFNSVGNQRHF